MQTNKSLCVYKASLCTVLWCWCCLLVEDALHGTRDIRGQASYNRSWCRVVSTSAHSHRKRYATVWFAFPEHNMNYSINEEIIHYPLLNKVSSNASNSTASYKTTLSNTNDVDNNIHNFGHNSAFQCPFIVDTFFYYKQGWRPFQRFCHIKVITTTTIIILAIKIIAICRSFLKCNVTSEVRVFL